MLGADSKPLSFLISIIGSGTISLDHDNQLLVDLPACFVGPWGPFEVGDEVKALFPDVPDKRLYDGTIVNKHIANDGVASYDIA